MSDLLRTNASGVFVKTTSLSIVLVFVLMGLSIAKLAGALSKRLIHQGLR